MPALQRVPHPSSWDATRAAALQMPGLRQNIQRLDWHATGAASEAGPLAEICRALNASEFVRAAAARAGVNASTSFRWRHRFLSARKDLRDQQLTGIVAVDECFVPASRKGERCLPRKARKRGGKAEKPGLSGEQTPIPIARDRDGHHLDAVLPNRLEKAVSAA